MVLLPLESDGFYTYMGSDDPDVPGNDGRPRNNVFDSNTINAVDVATKIKEGDGNVFTSEFNICLSTCRRCFDSDESPMKAASTNC